MFKSNMRSQLALEVLKLANLATCLVVAVMLFGITAAVVVNEVIPLPQGYERMFQSQDEFVLRARFLRHMVVPAVLLGSNLRLLLASDKKPASASSKIMITMALAATAQSLSHTGIEAHPREEKLLLGLRTASLAQGLTLLSLLTT